MCKIAETKIKLFKVMAMEIKAVPTLTGAAALRFVREADKAYHNTKKIDFSAEVKQAQKILKKAKMR